MSDFIYSAPDMCGYHAVFYNADGHCDECIEEDRIKIEDLKSFARLILVAPSNPSNDILKKAALTLLERETQSHE
jgi:hypothetical protein